MPATLEKRKQYRARSKKSLCRNKPARSCKKVKGCRMTTKSIKRKLYCRKSRSRRIR